MPVSLYIPTIFLSYTHSYALTHTYIIETSTLSLLCAEVWSIVIFSELNHKHLIWGFEN